MLAYSSQGDKIIFDNLTPLYPEKKISLESDPTNYSTRIIALFVPQGFGQSLLVLVFVCKFLTCYALCEHLNWVPLINETSRSPLALLAKVSTAQTLPTRCPPAASALAK